MPAKWQEVRVFISSTFSDMHAERDHLVKVVFPSLREKLEKHRIHLVEIDLRWGVTKEQADDDRALDLCLQQIDDCRPFFIGILGERYGYVPSETPSLSKPSYGWVQGLTGKSITELEIIHGVLNDHEMRPRSFFFFRNPRYLVDLPSQQQLHSSAEFPTNEEQVAVSQGWLSRRQQRAGVVGRRHKLKSLKQTILDAEVPVFENYPCQYRGLKINWRIARQKLDESDQHALHEIAGDGIVDPQEYARLNEKLRRFVDKEGVVYLDSLTSFGRAVHDQLWEATKAQHHLPETPPIETLVESDPLAEEDDSHKRYMESRLWIYVGRDTLQRALERFADANHTVPCLVTGLSGSGKSAAMARFVADYRNSHPGVFVIPHFVGASAASTSLRQMLRRFCLLLQQEFGFDDDIPLETNQLSNTFRDFLGRVPDNHRMLLVVDALNQLDKTEDAQSLYWLPWQLPPHVKFLTSCTDDRDSTETVLEVFGHRQHELVTIKPLTDQERVEIVEKVPSLSAKTLDSVQVELLLANPATTNPLFLLVALEELRGFGSFEQLDQRIVQLPRSDDDESRWQRWLAAAREYAQSLDDEKKRRDRLARLDAIESTLVSTPPADDPLTSLFLQVIDRLSDDFDANVVGDVLSLLGSARLGLSQRDLLDLVEGNDIEIADSGGDLFPVLRQLRAYLLYRAELLDFYHRNLAKAVNTRYLPTARNRHAAHRVLADYFRLQPLWRESPEMPPPPWDRHSNLRVLVELPWHLARSGQHEALSELLSRLAYLDARCFGGDVYGLLADYDLLPSPHDVSVEHLQSFLLARAQRLFGQRTALPALIWHEGTDDDRQRLQASDIDRPWIRTSRVSLPAPIEPNTDGGQLSVHTQVRFDSPAVGAVAQESRCLFFCTQLGQLNIIDLETGRKRAERIAIRPTQVLAVAVRDDGGFLAVVGEDASIEFLRVRKNLNGEVTNAESLATLSAILPEYDAPRVTFVGQTLWFQSAPRELTICTLTDEHVQSDRLTLPELSPDAELSACVLCGDAVMLAFRCGFGTLLTLVRKMECVSTLELLQQDVAFACPYDAERIVIACSDQRLAVIERCDDVLREAASTDCNEPPLLVYSDGDRVFWIDEVARFYEWKPGEKASTMLSGGGPMFLGPLDWRPLEAPRSVLLTRASASIVSVQDRGRTSQHSVQAIYIGVNKQVDAVLHSSDGVWHTSSTAQSAQFVAVDDNPVAVYGRNERNELLSARMQGQGFRLDLDAGDLRLEPGLPGNITGIVGLDGGDFLLVQRGGQLYSNRSDEILEPIGRVILREVTGASLYRLGRSLVLKGTCLHGTTVAETRDFLAFFEISPSSGQPQYRDHCLISPEKGTYTCLACDPKFDRLLVIVQHAARSQTIVRRGSIPAFVKGDEDVHELSGVGTNIVHAFVDAPGVILWLVSRLGALYAVDASTLSLIDVLPASTRVIHLSGQGDALAHSFPEVAVVDAAGQISFVEITDCAWDPLSSSLARGAK